MQRPLFLIWFLLIVILSSCNHSESRSVDNQTGGNSSDSLFSPISNTENQQSESEMDATPNVVPEASIENQESKGQQEPMEKNPHTEVQSKNNEESQELGYGIPHEKPIQQPNSQQLAKQESKLTQKIGQLPFKDFKERWNAISYEQGSNLIISSFEKMTANEGTYYHALFQKRLELRVFVVNDSVKSIQIIGHGRKTSDVLTMLTGWSQIYYILDPDYDPYHVDILFSDLGVGPNADLDHIEEHSIIHHGIQYNIETTDTGYNFQASYFND
jgi:hypothetical protein